MSNQTHKCSEDKYTCKYSTWCSGKVVCGYIIATGKRRGCDPEECTRYDFEIDKKKRLQREWAKGDNLL